MRGTIEKNGDRYAVAVPQAEVERLDLRDGESIILTVRPLPPSTISSDEAETPADRTENSDDDS